MRIGEHLRDRRRALGLSQYDLAALMGVNHKVISDWELGETQPKDHMPALCKFCRLSTADIEKLEPNKLLHHTKYPILKRFFDIHPVKSSEIAKCCNVTRQTVNSWQRGAYWPMSDQISRICSYLQIPVEIFPKPDDTELQAMPEEQPEQPDTEPVTESPMPEETPEQPTETGMTQFGTTDKLPPYYHLGVREQDGVIVVSSRDVARVFGKDHAHVLRAIRELDCSKNFTDANFGFSEYQDTTGRTLPEVLMTRDGFTFLAMGFTGAKAAEFKEAYITTFNKMEQQLKGKPSLAIEDLTKPDYLLAILKNWDADRKALIRLERQAEIDRPKLEFVKYVKQENEGLYPLSFLAKLLNQSGKRTGLHRLHREMREDHFIMVSRSSTLMRTCYEPTQKFVDNGWLRACWYEPKRQDGSRLLTRDGAPMPPRPTVKVTTKGIYGLMTFYLRKEGLLKQGEFYTQPLPFFNPEESEGDDE